MTDVRLQPVDGQEHALLSAQAAPQALRVGCGPGAPFVRAVQQVGDHARGAGDAAARALLMDFGNTAVRSITEASDPSDDVQAKFMMRPGAVGFGLGAVGTVVARASGVGAAADLER